MSKEGADKAGNKIASGLKWFAFWAGLSVFLIGMALFVRSVAPEGLIKQQNIQLFSNT